MKLKKFDPIWLCSGEGLFRKRVKAVFYKYIGNGSAHIRPEYQGFLNVPLSSIERRERAAV